MIWKYRVGMILTAMFIGWLVSLIAHNTGIRWLVVLCIPLGLLNGVAMTVRYYRLHPDTRSLW